jgi:hypothetical protein
VIGLSLPNISKYDAFAHIPVSNISRIQEWTDPSSGISTLFVYEPEKPIIDTFTELKFSIQNTTTGSHISDADNAKARVVVTNGQRLFKFENITVGDDGHFSVKYLFPGLLQIGGISWDIFSWSRSARNILHSTT